MNSFVERVLAEENEQKKNTLREYRDVCENNEDIDCAECKAGDKTFFWNKDKLETNESVDERLRELGIENVDLTGSREIWQKQVVESVEEMYEKYPEIRGFIGSIRTAELPKGVYACAGPRQMEEGIRAEIQLSKNYFSKYNLEFKIVDMEARNYDGEKWIAGRGLDGILKHEIGHVMHLGMIAKRDGVDINNASESQYDGIVAKYQRNAITASMCPNVLKELGISAKDIGKNLSVYGAHDFGEFFAEAISEYETAKKPRPIAVKIHEKYEEFMNQKEENL